MATHTANGSLKISTGTSALMDIASTTVTHTAPANATELVNVTSQKVQSSAFLRLPTELRSMIYEQVELLQSQGKTWSGWGAWCMNECTGVTRTQHKGIGLGALSQSCRSVHKETFDVLYDDRITFIIGIPTSYQQYGNLRVKAPTYSNIDFLRHVKRARVDFAIHYHDTENSAPPSAAAELRALGSIISTLGGNAYLQKLSFEPYAGSLGLDNRFKRIVGELRRQHTRDGTKAGRGMKERELDFAKVYVDMLRDMLHNLHGANELSFLRSFETSPPSFESLTHYFKYVGLSEQR